ncbi:MAG: 50S ribosome-binding GTPase [Planctomycetota bacterium]|nr:MAG: 50S ribosome-binding GTPase [Planctomycetota bacterium]
MYHLNDTIVAVSSPTSHKRVIVRISGPDTVDTVKQVFVPISAAGAGLISGAVAIDAELRIDAKLYLFLAPYSYTGDDVAEIHIHTNPSLTKALIGNLLKMGLRMAGPGEFTARSFLNGKIDLAQAEAVNEIITCSNKFQLAAAERLFSGRLAETAEKIRSQIIDCLSLIEAGLDFSGEDIEFVTNSQAVERLTDIKHKLEQLLDGSISCESVLDLPAVGIAAAPNAGKSSLLNRLIGKQRSIVSPQRKTTRDVLTGLLSLRHSNCVLFDCAGLIQQPNNILDELAHQAAIASLQKASVVVFCVDVSKEDWSEDIAIRKLFRTEVLVPVATKSDLLQKNILAKRITELDDLFDTVFLAVSVKTSAGIEQLKTRLDERIIELATGTSKLDMIHEIRDLSRARSRDTRYEIALTARHKQAVNEAIEDISESISELKAGSDEVAAMMLRAAYQALSGLQQHIDEKILERIFSRFCIGK